MTTALRPSALALFVGDIIFFIIALWVTLFLRSFSLPPAELLYQHIVAFAPLFVVWVVVYFIAGLYEGRRILFARRALSMTLLSSQLVNVGIAALFFFFIPTFGIAPKTVLLIYLFVSFLFVLLWRTVLFPQLGLQRAEPAIVVGESGDLSELTETLAHSPLSPIAVVARITPGKDTEHALERAIVLHHPRFIIADFDDTRIAHVFPGLYNLVAEGVRFIDASALYEEVFGRVPLSRVDERWIAHNISRPVHLFYDPLKRVLDIVLGFLIGAVSLIFYPFIMLAIYSESGRPLFISQERIGEWQRPVRLYKFRTMTGNDEGKYTNGTTALRVTHVGRVLRSTRLDELPQLWNILRGDLSLIGPRPEFPGLAAEYEREIPYYSVRHLIRPGLSGWAQLYHDNHPHHGSDVVATREKLSYDLYYLKHRSLMLDGIIVLKTIAKVFTRTGK